MDASLDIELWKFHDIFFDEGTHSYTDSLGTEYTSVTKFVHQFSEEQDWDEIARKYAIKHDYGNLKEKLEKVPPEKAPFVEAMAVLRVREEWSHAGDRACVLGTHVHAFMENQWKRKRYAPDVEPEGYKELATTGQQAYKELSQRFVPIREEFIVYNATWGICGTIDFLAYDTLKDRIVILDYKTNKKIEKENPHQQCIGPLAGRPDCNYIHYSAQLSAYKAILESGSSVRVGGMALVHIRKDGYSVIPCIDFSGAIKEYLDGRTR